MNTTRNRIWFFLAVIFAIFATIYILSWIVIAPWRSIVDIGGDGGKNIFTYLYHSVYGKGYWFEGMNYPYGEHLIYTDGQPILSFLFAKSGNVSVPVALTALWWLIGLSYVLCITYLYKILVHFKVAPLIAMVFAGIICVFSPQLFRVAGHYALAYNCVIPMVFYWTVKYNEARKLKYCLYIFLLGTTVAFLHLYFAAMLLIWAMCYAVAYWITGKDRWSASIRHIYPVVLSVLAVFAVTGGLIMLSDPIKDRPKVPYGILDYATTGKDIVTSIYSPVWRYISDHGIYHHVSEGGEGFTYIGIVAVLIVIASLFVEFSWRRKNKAGLVVRKEVFSPLWLFVALGALLMGMGVPFVWHMAWLLNYVSFWRQFRTLGRFSWIFYYIITVYSVVAVYQWYLLVKASRQFFYAYALLIVPIMVWGYEASGYVRFSRKKARESTYYYEAFFSKDKPGWIDFLNGHHYSSSNFQALLLVPFFHVGTEKIWLDGEWLGTLGFEASMQLHLPIVDVKMSRSSWSQAEKQVKIAAGPFADKPMLDDIKSDKPFLLLHFEDDSLDPDQKYLLESADYIGHFSQCNVYAFYPDRLRALQKKIADSVDHIVPFLPVGDSCVVNKGQWYVNHFDGDRAVGQLYGNGAMPAIQGGDTSLLSVALRPREDSELYEFSCWVLLDTKDYSSPTIKLELKDSTGQVVKKLKASPKTSVDNYGMWFRAACMFYMQPQYRSMTCKLVNDPAPSYLALDELMLRPYRALIISKSVNGSIMVNNHLFKNGKQ